ncbi:hypothetical protein HGRIS_012510 [Hohenbuehelia grisea]|uniref:Velvet domain-containing protein n=1 Tax=Hohenbuehelia grisea TaxID=104357 RepID=A0ABR3ISF7_9AGAR
MNGHFTTVFHQSQFAETQHQVHNPQLDTAHHTSPTSQPGTAHQPAGNTDFLGKPIHFATGQFAGHTIRAELQEIQKADLGRKYARVDRRPLDPPPVVLLKLFYVYPTGPNDEPHEDEVQNYDEVQNLGLVCTVDLFPVPSQADPVQRDIHPIVPLSPPNGHAIYPPGGPSPPRISAAPTNGHPVPFQMYPTQTQMTATTSALRSTVTAYLPTIPSPIVHHVNGFPIAESSKMTAALVGATFVQPSTFEYQGKKSLVFVFAVGVFLFRR